MTGVSRPRRTLLYLPAANARAIEKARALPADTVILDLEDAVAPDRKADAREAAAAAVAAGGWGGREVAIRVNGLATDWHTADFAAAAGADLIVVPKVETAAEAARAVALAGGRPVFAMIETPRGVLACAAIAAVPGIAGLLAGFADLANELRARPGPDRLALLVPAGHILLGARAAGIPAFDGVFTDIRDTDGLAREARQARDWGFDGKSCIHPAQLETVNRAFSPSAGEIADAHGLIAAHEAAMAQGRGVATYRGRLVEGLHVADARRLLDLAGRLA